ncbi:hypothetical protein NAEGRDRAFT_44581 [Naegleria gruberi]|uniref:Actin n=1 Tax=Naegleria gruberi TaxID=5762 RepID=D2VH92_NAEGR|nr:uncharacterized protein NAEGRDRAFT_44581 [Naegleria gruberi]EFC43759.1 hypothetical protein NAEGRDRAFT_44581 [Naegleria gruberi]|eukprot:XP_002676503.1 hypothetical protein NAEGRDRAFT_44581 [Naegleria gruberi strain NEG-M]
MAFEDLTTIVLDVGSFRVRAGIAGDDEPKINIPTLASRNPKFKSTKSTNLESKLTNNEQDDADTYLKREYLIGSEIIDYEIMNNDGKLEITSPFGDGKEINVDVMERIWRFTFEQLKVEPEECPLVMIEHALTEKRVRETKMQIMFESFGIPMYYSGYDSVMSMYASGRVTGITVNMGYEETQIVPVFEGFALPHAIMTMNFGGRQLTEYLAQKLKLDGHNLTNDQVSQLKEKLCRVAEDYDEELRTIDSASFELPDGNVIQIKNERLTCPEIYFNPQIFQSQEIGPIHLQTYSSIQKCDIDGRRFWYSNILLTGASSCFPKMTERLTKEMVFLSPSSMKVKVIGAPERNIQAWLGGSILGSISASQTMFITREEYEEVGPVLVHRRCF